MRASPSAVRFRIAVALIAVAGLAVLIVGLRSGSTVRKDDAASPPLPKFEETAPRR